MLGLDAPFGFEDEDENEAPSAERRAPSAERRAPSAERRTPNAERRTPNAKRQNAKRQTPNAKRQTPNGERQTYTYRWMRPQPPISTGIRNVPRTSGAPARTYADGNR